MFKRLMQTPLTLAALVLLVGLALPIQARADSPSVVESNSVTPSINPLDPLLALPAVKEGFMYNISQNRGMNILGLEVINGGIIGSSPNWKALSGNVAWMGVDGIGGTIDYGLGNLPVDSVPVLKYVQYLHFGYGFGVRTVTAPEDDNPKSDNRLIHGPVVYLKFKF